MDDRTYIESLVEKARKALDETILYSNDRWEEIVKAVAKASVDHADEIGKINYEETGMGSEDELAGLAMMAPILFYGDVKGKQSLGLIDEDPVTGLKTYAKPMGVLCCSAPSTTPVYNLDFVAINGLKSGNAIISCPHPNASKCIHKAVQVMRDALKSVGAPEDLVQAVEDPTIERSGILMETCDAIIAVGGENMVKNAYRKGKPCFGVGQGNVQCMIGKDYEDLDNMAGTVFSARIGNNGVPCTGEQTIWVPQGKLDAVLKAFEPYPVCVVDDPKVLDEMRAKFFGPNGINRAIVGKKPPKAMKNVEIEVPGMDDEVRLLILIVNNWSKDEPLMREIMFPVVRINVYDNWEDAVMAARGNLLREGAGHTCTLWTTDEKEIDFAATYLPVGRLICEGDGAGASGSPYNGIPWTNAVGCGTWGGNSISENLNYKHLRNFTKVANQSNVANAAIPAYEDLFED